MTLFQMAVALTACDGAMILEGVDGTVRSKVIERLGKSLAQVAMRDPAPSHEAGGFYCERCQHYYRGENQCPRHGR